ncbi:MAG: glycine cleavage system protein T [Rhodospirillaceae bacterium]|nr:glycine cleavage system protein T [Rhodospirillaceae bacterium]|tara:strand:- start:748 stop:1860 length:1113 start_codon:yes stop_codon:yes gene_type:complete
MKTEENLSSLKTKLFDLHAVYGARFIEFAGYLVPLAYSSGTIKETISCRDSASIFDVSHMGQIGLMGESAALELDKLVPTDISSLGINKSSYTVFLNNDAGIVDDLIVTKKNKSLFLVVNASQKTKILHMLKDQLSSKISIKNFEDNSLVSLQGPRSSEVLKSLFSNINELKFMNGFESHFDESPVYVSRTGYTGEDGFEVSIPNKSVEKFFDYLIDNSLTNLAGFGARDVLRIEAGLCLYGQDINNSISPVEAGLSWLINKKKLQDLSFIGSEKLKSQYELSPKMHRIGIELDSKVIARNGAKIYNVSDEKIGFITSGCFSPNISKSICMGYVSKLGLSDNKNVFVEVRGKSYEGKLVKMPFISHKYNK